MDSTTRSGAHEPPPAGAHDTKPQPGALVLHAGARFSLVEIVLVVLASSFLVFFVAWRWEAVRWLWMVVGAGMVVMALIEGGARYRLDGEALTITRWWGRVERYALSDLKSVKITSALQAAVGFRGRLTTITLSARRADHIAIVEALRRVAHGARPPAFDHTSGRVRLPALVGLPRHACAVCGSTNDIRTRAVTAHHGVHLIAFAWIVRRGFELPVCPDHLWRRRLASLGVAVVAVATLLGAIALTAASPPGGPLDPYRPIGLALFFVFLTILLAAANDLTKYLLDHYLLGVRLGWLSADGDSSAIHVASQRVRELLDAHLGKAPGSLAPGGRKPGGMIDGH